MFTQLRDILYTDFQDMLVLSSTLHSATTSDLQRTAPVQEIMDNPSVSVCVCVCVCHKILNMVTMRKWGHARQLHVYRICALVRNYF
jgi:hypothetical protein